MVYCGTDQRNRKNLDRENDFFNQISILLYDAGRTSKTFIKQIECRDSAEERDGISGYPLLRDSGPSGTKDHAKDKSIDTEHEDRLNQRPEKPEIGAFIAARHLTSGKLRQKISVSPYT